MNGIIIIKEPNTLIDSFILILHYWVNTIVACSVPKPFTYIEMMIKTCS